MRHRRGGLARWFVPTGNGDSVRKELRRSVVFGVNNLVSDAPVSRIDLILCRNVFIYMDPELQKWVLSRFHFALRNEGALVLGRSELIPFAAKLFEPVDLQRRIYRKNHRQDFALAPHERLEVPHIEELPHREAKPSPTRGRGPGAVDAAHPALKRTMLMRVRKYLTENRSLRLEDVSYQLPHGGRGRATLVATPLIMETQRLGSIILFEDTTRLAALMQENRELKERLKK